MSRLGVTVHRPDFSEFVVHFTKDTPPIVEEQTEPRASQIAPMTAKDRLFSILDSGEILATRMPWTNRPAVCFTECTWGSLLFHAQRYSRFGVGFHKAFLFAAGGGPAIYLPPGLMEHQKSHVPPGTFPFHSQVFAFITPFIPPYAPKDYKDKFWGDRASIDFSHEREWRVPHSLTFEAGKVAFVIVDSYADMAKAPKKLKDEIGRKNWLIMDNYERIEEFWPLHYIP